MEIMKKVCSKEANGKNLVYSPLSIYSALGLLTFGAKGETLNQLLRFLKSENLDDLNAFCSEVTKSLNETQACSNSQGFKLSCVSVWVEQSRVLNPKYKELASLTFQAVVEAVDFKFKANEERLKVNQWVAQKTNGLIKDLIGEGVVNSSTMIILVNALYFKGSWRPGQFDKGLTRNSEFYLLNEHSAGQVPFMHSRKTHQYISCHNGFKVLKLPYQVQEQAKTKISMYIVLPDRHDGLGDLVEKASTDSASFLNQCLRVDPPLVQTGQFKIPKFKMTFDFDTKTVLEEMGLVLPFGPQAELTGMVNSNGLVKSVIHKCFVEVDEEGTVAAAATAVVVGAFGCSAPPVYTDFVADHPFMFMIKDSYTGVVLFTGYVLNPLLTS